DYYCYSGDDDNGFF
nr:immunoglobulin light chain junction region [Macaca mulatta]